MADLLIPSCVCPATYDWTSESSYVQSPAESGTSDIQILPNGSWDQLVIASTQLVLSLLSL